MTSAEPSPALFCIVDMAISRNSGSRPNPTLMSEMWQLAWTLFAIAFDHLTKLFEQ